jgi:hypothetical protein
MTPLRGTDGHIDLFFGRKILGFKIGRTVRIHGGPIVRAGGLTMHRLNLRAEAPDLVAESFLPIKDYSVPDPVPAYRALERFLNQAIEDGEVFVGCAGGIGRTGLIMALCAKAAGDPNPIKTVRAQYKSHAVETMEQNGFVSGFPTALLAVNLNRAAFVRAFKFWKR